METPDQSDKSLISVLDAELTELGGIYARQGFSYQDHVAVTFFLQMIVCEDLAEVWCETHDDILLVWGCGQKKIAEYVQVKSELPDQLWTIAKLCERGKEGKNQSGVGTSLLEKSLSWDRYLEASWFRIVTSRQINSSLEVLTRQRGHEDRSIKSAPFKMLVAEVDGKVGEFKSEKGNGVLYWLTNACWEVRSENEIETLNIRTLINTLFELGHPYDPDVAKFVYGNLQSVAKNTAELGPENRKRKRVTREGLLGKIEEWLQPYPNSTAANRLEKKLADAGLDSVCFNVATDLRRLYLTKKRSAAYLSTEESEDVELAVLHLLHTLRSSLDGGDISESGVEFHSRCLKSLYNASVAPKGGIGLLPSSYLSGCMYEITARCRHRFIRLKL